MKVILLWSAVLLLLLGCSRPAAPAKRIPAQDVSFRFAVIGDNRGVSDAAPVFLELIDSMAEEKPGLIVNTGDMINGYEGDTEAQLRLMWQSYQTAISKVPASAYVTPGNHDLFDATSAKIWKELWGPTYYTFDYHHAKFVVLDTETEPGRLGDEQFLWLKKKLADDRPKQLFIFLHRPLFPVDGHIGSSMDEFPAERDELHRLFVEHRDRIQAVFAGHEHMYYHQEHEGVNYYTTAGGGAELYMPAELGGFYHYLLVDVTADRARVRVKQLGSGERPVSAPRRVEPGDVLEDFDHGLLWYVWDHSVTRSLTRDVATQGVQALKVTFDLNKCEFPVVMGSLEEGWNLEGVDELKVDVYVPEEQAAGLKLTPVIEGSRSCEAPTVTLKAGWNTVTAKLSEPWLDPQVRSRAKQLQWNLAALDQKASGWVAFDNLLATGPNNDVPNQGQEVDQSLLGKFPRPIQPGALLEGWEQHSLWGAWTETVPPSESPRLKTQGEAGLKVNVDFSRNPRPSIYSSPDPAWDLTAVDSLTADVFLPDDLKSEVRIGLVLGQQTNRYAAPTTALSPGWNHLKVDLGKWLPAEARKSIEVIQWQLTGASKSKTRSAVVIDNLKAGSRQSKSAAQEK